MKNYCEYAVLTQHFIYKKTHVHILPQPSMSTHHQ